MHSPTTIVAVITEYSEKKASYPICVAIKKGNGLKKDSVVNLSQIRTIDKNRLITPKLGALSKDSSVIKIEHLSVQFGNSSINGGFKVMKFENG